MEQEKLYDDYFKGHRGPHHLWYVQPIGRTSKRIGLLRGPGYYDNPEGTDIIGKVWGINKHAIVGALSCSAIDSLCISLISTPLQYLNVLGFYMVPSIACATTFATVVYMANDIRKVDDRNNYILGATACYPILHAWSKCISWALPGTFVLIGIALIKKHSVDNNVNAIMLPHTFRKKLNTIENDYSWIKDEWPRRPIY